MKPVAPDAGSRRALLKTAAGLAAALCAGCFGTPQRRGDALLNPLFSITGARLVTRVDAAGSPLPGAFGQHVPLVYPVAAAASFTDVYIADAGTSRLYRYDRSFDAMAVMPDGRITQDTRLAVGPDGSLYVLDPASSAIRRYSRSGRPLPTLPPRQATSRYSAFAVDPLSGRGYAVDSAHRVVDEIQPLGTLAILFQHLDEAGPIAADGRGLFLGSAQCGCVVEWIQGRPGRRFGAGKLRQPRAIALLGPNIFVLDGFDRSIALVHEEGIEAMTPSALGLLQPESLSAAGDTLLVADGPGHRVTALRPGARLAR